MNSAPAGAGAIDENVADASAKVEAAEDVTSKDWEKEFTDIIGANEWGLRGVHGDDELIAAFIYTHLAYSEIKYDKAESVSINETIYDTYLKRNASGIL